MSRSSRRPAAGFTGRLARDQVEHVVQFYPAEEELAVQVARYLDELEESWNGLGARLPFSPLCGYPASVLACPDDADAVRGVGRLPTATADQRSFPAGVASVRAARHYATGLLEQDADERVTGDAALVVTELATNAVLHARAGFTLTVTRSPAGVKVAVRDHAPLAPPNESGPFRVLTGHGLSVVDQLAGRWSVERLRDGKLVWAELPWLR